jgi:hypothetical protein
MKGIKAAVLEERLCAQPLPETSSTAQDAAARAEQELEQKDERLRERKAGKERLRQQAREKEQQQAIEEEAGAGAMEAPPPAEAMDDDKCMAVFLEWSNKGGYLTRSRFDNAKEEDLDAIPLSFEQLNRVLLLLEERDPAAWLLTKEGHGPPTAPPPTAAEASPPPPAPPVAAAVDEVVVPQGACVICYDEPVSVSLVHANETSHLCVCVGCSDLLKANGAPCPICRQGIVVHLKTMYAATQVMH